MKTKKILALAIVLAMCLGMLAACGNGGNGGEQPNDKEENNTPLVVGYAPFSSKFSPFFSETAYDQDAMSLTQVGLLGTDRKGAMIMNGIKGETINYNGTDYTYYGIADCKITQNADGSVYYDFQLREDVKFSDGKNMTIDDVIFSMYVLCDPTYDGSSTLFALPIQGMKEYRSGMDTRLNLILAAGPDGYVATEYFTQAQYDAFWTAFWAAGTKFAQEIVDYCLANYASYGAVDVKTSAGLWGYELADGATAADFFKAIVAAKGYDLSDDGINYETAGTSIKSFIEAELGSAWAEYVAGVQTGSSAASISGIQKTGNYSMRVVLTEVDATAIYQLSLTVAPMHYYGDAAQYDYTANKFGFPKGDLALIRAKTTQPMGAGPYKFQKFENGVISYEANEHYYLGAPKTKYVNLMEVQEADKLNGVTTGTLDITDPSFSVDAVAAIQKANGGTLNGNKVTVSTVDNLGYGYLGMSANSVNVKGEPGSEASKNLRKALATVLAVYRDVSVDSYYAEAATVINYPISNTSWAAPQTTDDGYKVAFSTDVNGQPIYTSGMTAEQKYDAALKAALGFFEAAGYTVADGKVTAAPEGAKMEYELLIPADGAGDHPSFMLCTEAAKALEKIGIKLIVTDLTNSSDLWTALEADQCELWCAAWGATIDPDMYQIYFSGDDTGRVAGGSNYMYDIDDPQLNKLILDARASLDQTYRKAMYKACLDIIVDWAVEIPVYQRQNCIIFSSERVDVSTVTPDITTFYGWMSEIQNLKLK